MGRALAEFQCRGMVPVDGGAKRRTNSLRTTLSTIVVVLGLMTLGTAAFLVALAIQLRGSMGVVAAAVESVHLAEGLEVDLLLHGRTTDRLALAEVESRLLQKVARTEKYVTTDEERAALVEVQRTLERYFGARASAERADLELGAAIDALEEFVDVNVAQAAAEDALFARWTSIASAAGIVIAVVLLGTVVGALVWLRRSAFRPVFDIAGVMSRFREGRRSERAREAGPIELREMAQQFNRMADALDRQHEAQLVSLAGVAHDLRNPLSALKMALATLSAREEAYAGPTDRTLAIVRRQVDRLDRMVGDLLDAARIESGQLDLRIEECDVRPILDDVCELYRSISPGHRIALNAPSAPVRLPCDRLRIEQVLGNLVSNAVKYSPEGGRIEVALSLIEDAAVISVSDCGLGIDRERQARVFQPFQRASSDAIPGVGLGLFVAKRIVEAHAGRIEMESAPGEGSTFRVRLPIHPVARSAGAPAP
jgi:signal transduction histidine kinase